MATAMLPLVSRPADGDDDADEYDDGDDDGHSLLLTVYTLDIHSVGNAPSRAPGHFSLT